MTEAPPPQWAFRQRLLDLLRGYRSAQILITCTELGVFEALADGSRTAEELAAMRQTDRRGMSLLLNASVALGLLKKRNSRYANPPMAEVCLVREGPHYLGNFIKREGAFYRRWSHLTAAVKSGQRPEDNVRDEEAEDWVRWFDGNFSDYGADRRKRFGIAADTPHRIRYKQLTRAKKKASRRF